MGLTALVISARQGAYKTSQSTTGKRESGLYSQSQTFDGVEAMEPEVRRWEFRSGGVPPVP